MKRKFLCAAFIFTLLVAAFSLCSCHGKRALDPFVMPDSFDTDSKIEISFWAKNDNNTTQQNIYNKAAESFEKIYPNINVTIRPFFNYNDIYKEVLTNIRTDTTPNVCITYPDHIASYNSSIENVVALDALMSDELYGFGGSALRFDSPNQNEVIQKFMDEGKINGTQYALPFMRSTEACYINEDLVKALGYTVPENLTWDFVFEVSRAAMQPISYDDKGKPVYINGQSSIVPFVYKSTDNMMIQMLKQKGYDYSSENGDVLIFNDGTKEILYTVASEVSVGAFSTFDIANAYPGDLLNAGMCIFGVDSTAGATWMGPDAPNMDIDEEAVIDFNMVVTEIPQFYPETPAMISQGPSICIFNKKDTNTVLASWLFAQYLLTNEVQIAYAQTEGYVPVTSTAQGSPEYQDYLSRSGEDNNLYYDIKIEATKLLLENIDNTFITPVFNGSASLRNAAGLLIEQTGKSVKRGIAITDEQINAIYKQSSSLYKLDEISDNQIKDGKLPTGAIVLISTLACAWITIMSYLIFMYVKARKKEQK